VPTAIKLTVSASPALKRDDFGIRLSVENLGREAFDWDKDFVGGLEWRVALGDGTKFLGPEVMVVNLTKVVRKELAHRKLAPDSKANPLALERFDRLEPGKSITREISLQSLGEQNAYMFENALVSKPHFSNFKLPAAAKLVRARVRYQPNHSSLGAVYKRDQLHLAPATESNALEILLK
jgi:hypothetical protein